MENNTQNADTLILDKKLNNYGRNDDFVAPKELTVTITLAEYRMLVANNAKHTEECDKYQKKVWALESENKKLKETLEALKSICPMNSPTEPNNNNNNNNNETEE